MNTWKVEYKMENGKEDTFVEWYEVTNGDRTFKCNSQEDADWLCDKLNHYSL